MATDGCCVAVAVAVVVGVGVCNLSMWFLLPRGCQFGFNSREAPMWLPPSPSSSSIPRSKPTRRTKAIVAPTKGHRTGGRAPKGQPMGRQETPNHDIACTQKQEPCTRNRGLLLDIFGVSVRYLKSRRFSLGKRPQNCHHYYIYF